MNKVYKVLDDPLLSPEQMCLDAGISLATWRRNYRHKLNIVQVSRRRIGVRRSDWCAALGENVRRQTDDAAD